MKRHVTLYVPVLVQGGEKPVFSQSQQQLVGLSISDKLDQCWLNSRTGKQIHPWTYPTGWAAQTNIQSW